MGNHNNPTRFPAQMKLFCRLYVEQGCRNATAAAIAAGYSAHSATTWSSRTLARRDVSDYVAKLVAMHRRGLPLDGPLMHVVDGPPRLAPPTEEPIAGSSGGGHAPPPKDGVIMGPDDNPNDGTRRPYGVRRILTAQEELERRVLVEEAFRVYHTAMGDYAVPVTKAIMVESRSAEGFVVQSIATQSVEITNLNLAAANTALKFLSEQLELIHSARANAEGGEGPEAADEDALLKAAYREKLVRMSAERRKRMASTG